MSNLLKRGTTINKAERVIDYNELIKNKLQSMMSDKNGRVDADGFVNGLNADVVEELISGSDEENLENTDAAIDEAMAREKAQAIINDANEQAQQIIAEANSEANSVIENAGNEAERIATEARNRGYQEGIQSAQQQMDNEMANLESEYEQKKQQLQQEYEQMKADIEPKLVDVLTDVFRKVTLTVAEDNQEIILHLINGVMRNADSSRDFIIKVSPEDYKFLLNNQGKIYCAMSREVNIDIVEDMTMERNQCIIETDTGVFNCSLDIELRNLIKDLKLLSCV
ncbi:MAG: FliH/SctL family protein [Eubacteriales bacterium]|nr:FliH/SctL family protein [Eubacteriales bacterium]